LLVFPKKIILNRIFCFPFVRGVSSELAPARPFPWGDAPLPLWLKLVDCIFKKYFCVQLNFNLGASYLFNKTIQDSKGNYLVSSKLDQTVFKAAHLHAALNP